MASALVISWVLIGCGGFDHSQDIGYIPGHQVDGLVVLDPKYDRWFVTDADNITLSADRTTLAFRFGTQACASQGLVGYAIDASSSTARLTVVAGESGSNCDAVHAEHSATVKLSKALAPHTTIVATKPDYRAD